MIKKTTTERVMSILQEAYRLGRDFESESQTQPDPEVYDGLCEYVAQETARLHSELMALIHNHDAGETTLPLVGMLTTAMFALREEGK